MRFPGFLRYGAGYSTIIRWVKVRPKLSVASTSTTLSVPVGAIGAEVIGLDVVGVGRQG